MSIQNSAGLCALLVIGAFVFWASHSWLKSPKKKRNAAVLAEIAREHDRKSNRQGSQEYNLRVVRYTVEAIANEQSNEKGRIDRGIT